MSNDDLTFGQYLDGVRAARRAGRWWHEPAALLLGATITIVVRLAVRAIPTK